MAIYAAILRIWVEWSIHSSQRKLEITANPASTCVDLSTNDRLLPNAANSNAISVADSVKWLVISWRRACNSAASSAVSSTIFPSSSS